MPCHQLEASALAYKSSNQGRWLSWQQNTCEVGATVLAVYMMVKSVNARHLRSAGSLNFIGMVESVEDVCVWCHRLDTPLVAQLARCQPVVMLWTLRSASQCVGPARYALHCSQRLHTASAPSSTTDAGTHTVACPGLSESFCIFFTVPGIEGCCSH